RSQNITQAVIEAAGGSLTICGQCLNNTTVGDASSAQEAMCVSPRGDQTLQLARQLTAAALNCVMRSPGPLPLSGDPCAGMALDSVFRDCNENVCLGKSSALGLSVGDCISLIDCFNNGGQSDGTRCVTGTCGGGGQLCNGSSDCGSGPLGPIPCVSFPS